MEHSFPALESPDCNKRDAGTSHGVAMLGVVMSFMNAYEPNSSAASTRAVPVTSQPSGPASSIPIMFRPARGHDITLSPGHFLIRLRQRHIPESPLNRHRKLSRFVTES